MLKMIRPGQGMFFHCPQAKRNSSKQSSKGSKEMHAVSRLAKAVAGLTLVIPLLFAQLAMAQTPNEPSQLQPRTFPIENVKSFRYHSSIMDRWYDISISVPPGYTEDPDRTYPALLVTDGNRIFPVVHILAGGLASVPWNDIEQPIIVSIGTPFEDGEMAWNTRRTYEFSPPDWDLEDPWGQFIKQSCAEVLKVELPDCIGGAPRFLNFINSELLPVVSKDYRINSDDIGLLGISAGGFFAAWAIFQEDSPFTKYLISSPGMAYGDGEVFRLEAQYAEEHDDLPVSIYIGSGMLEMDDAWLEGMGQIVSGHARLSGVLRSRNYPNLELISEVHDGLGHMDTPAVVVARGLRTLYRTDGQ